MYNLLNTEKKCWNWIKNHVRVVRCNSFGWRLGKVAATVLACSTTNWLSQIEFVHCVLFSVLHNNVSSDLFIFSRKLLYTKLHEKKEQIWSQNSWHKKKITDNYCACQLPHRQMALEVLCLHRVWSLGTVMEIV